MASSPENLSMALFCDFENVALGVRDTKFDKFDIKPVLERLLLKGSIVVKKAYCDWDRYKGFKSTMHEANFELIEIPHVRQSGKNSADIRLVVDALDLCYTKAHINTFVIISGDSDFSPLVSKLRENNKQVIGVGVKQSTSDLLIANCDEFIFYDDLVRESQHAADRRETREAHTASRRPSGEDKRRKDDLDTRKTRAVEIAVETFDALMAERGDSGKIWASVLKEAIKRRRPDFNESYFGFRAFGNLLEEAQSRGLLEFGRDEKSGAYVFRASAGAGGAGQDAASDQTDKTSHSGDQAEQDDHAQAASGRRDGSRAEASRSDSPRTDRDKPESRRRSRGGRSASNRNADAHRAQVAGEPNAGEPQQADEQQPADEQPIPAQTPARVASRGWQPPAAWDEPLDTDTIAQGASQAPASVTTQDDLQDAPTPKPSRSRASRAGRTTRKSREAAVDADADTTETTSNASQLPGLDATAQAQPDSAAEPLVQTSAPTRSSGTRTASRRASGRGAPKTATPPTAPSATDTAPATTVAAAPVAAPPAAPVVASTATPPSAPDASPAKPARKTPARARRPRKTTAPDGE